MSLHGNLLGPEPTRLPVDPAVAELAAGADPVKVAAAHPTSSAAWATLAEAALADGAPVTAYAYARTGYHRGLDQLRRAGWKGFGAVPVGARAQPRLPARAGRAAPGRRRDRGARRGGAVRDVPRRLRPGGPAALGLG